MTCLHVMQAWSELENCTQLLSSPQTRQRRRFWNSGGLRLFVICFPSGDERRKNKDDEQQIEPREDQLHDDHP